MRSSAVRDSGASLQLACGIVNSADGTATGNVIYITPDPGYNQVSFQIGLASGKTTLTPGTVPDPMSPPGPGSGTTLYLDLGALELTAEAWDQIKFDAAGWTFRTFADQGVVGMTPAGAPVPVTSGTGGAVSIGIQGIVVPAPLSLPQVQIYVSYFNIPDITGMCTTFAVTVQNAPDQQSHLSEAIAVSLGTNDIINSIEPLLVAANQFALQFTNREQLVEAGPDTTFSVSFVYGAAHDQYGYGALTDATKAKKISVEPGDNAVGWAITQDRNAQAVTWTLQPPAGAPIVGTGAKSVVTINFSNVITTYQPGPTTMLVSYGGVPGYRDGTFTLVLDKVPHVAIGSLEVTPNPAYLSGGSAKCTASWKVADPQSLELTQNYQTTPVTGKNGLPVTLDAERTSFTLKATGQPGTVDNSDYKTIEVVALPVINSFTGSPTEIYYGASSHDATFSWAVDSTDDVTLSSTGGAFGGQAFRAIGSTPASITQTQMVTLAPITAADPLTLIRRLVISAFKPTPRSYPLSFTPASVIASPIGPFVVLAGPSTMLTVVDTVRYASSGGHELGHAASALAFSADGRTLATANTDRTVSVTDVTPGPDGMPVFGTPQTITLNGAPQQLIFGPGGSRIYVTLDPGGGATGQVVSLLHSAGGYQAEATVTVGRAPRGLALDASGGRLFVANSGDDTVTIVGLSNGKPGGTKVIDGLTGGPVGLAAPPSGRQLLVSCATAGTVIAVDPDHPNLGTRTTLTVGGSPGQIALLPGGAYAAVANPGNGAISLVDCWGQVRNARLAGPLIAVGAKPAAVTASPDGLQVLVAVAGGFSLVTLDVYQASADPPPSIPNHPTSVAVSPDGASVFVWHDAQIPAPSPSPGILVYHPVAGSISNLLADKNVLRLVVSPDPLAKQALAIVEGDPALHMIETDTLEVETSPLGLASGAAPIALAISGEGQTLSVVARDAARNLTLLVLEREGAAWTKVQVLPLYQATAAGQILLRSTSDGTTLFLLDVSAAQVRVLRRSGQAYRLLPTPLPGDLSVLDLAVLPDGSTAYLLNAGQRTNTITVIDVASLTSHVAAIPQIYANLRNLSPSPDGRRLFATDASAAALRMLDPRSLRILQTIPLATDSGAVSGLSGLAVMPDGSAIFAVGTLSQNLCVAEQVQLGTGPALTGRRPVGGLLGGAYSGLFVRHYLGEQPGAPADGWSGSPDVFPYGQTIQPDLTTFTSAQGYAKDFGTVVSLTNPNYVYVRGFNPSPAPITSRVYFYYTRGSLALWPGNWRSDNTTVNGAARNWVDVTAAAASVAAGQSPFLWTPPTLDPGSDHYCIVAWVADGADPQPPDLASYSQFATTDDLAQFVVAHHNVAWRNTVDVVKPPPDFSYNTALSMSEGGGLVYLTVTFKNVPEDGTFAVNVQGPDPANSVALPASPLADYKGGYSPRNNPLTFPSNFATSVQVLYWHGPTAPPPTAQIKVTMLVPTAPSLLRDIERLYRPTGLRTPVRRLGGIPVVVLGTVQYNLLFGPGLERGAVTR